LRELGFVREIIAEALVNGNYLKEQGKFEEAIALYNKVARIVNDTEWWLDVRDQAQKAFTNKGDCLMKQGKYKEALALDDEFVQRFGDDDSAQTNHERKYHERTQTFLLRLLSRLSHREYASQ